MISPTSLQQMKESLTPAQSAPAPATSNATTMTTVVPDRTIEGMRPTQVPLLDIVAYLRETNRQSMILVGTDEGVDTCTPPNSATGPGPSSSLWDSPAIQRVIAPLKQTLSMSAEHLPPRAKSPLARMQWAIRQSQKCQSVD